MFSIKDSLFLNRTHTSEMILEATVQKIVEKILLFSIFNDDVDQ